jgi:transglutaminase-like putative cysteine protease
VSALVIVYRWGPADTRWWGLPTWNTLDELRLLGADGQDVINRFSPPVPSEPGVIMLTVLGIAVVAIAVDLLAVGLRLVPLAGLPLLALYTVPVAVTADGVPWLLFVLAASSFVGLLVAEGRERLSRWGRSMGYSEREVTMHAFLGEVETGAIARVGRRIGAAAVCLAVAVPVVVPVLDGGLFGGGIGGNGPGGRQIVVGDPIVDLVRDLQRDQAVDLFTYDTLDPTPEYFRMSTLDSFDGIEWKRTEHELPDSQIITGPIPDAPASSTLPSTDRTTRVEIGEIFSSRWLPLPYPATSLTIEPGRWVYDADSLNVFGIDNTTAGVTYEVVSRELDYDSATPTNAAPPNQLDRYLTLPELPAEVTEIADQVVADAGATTPMAQAIALQSWFRDSDEFEYSLDVAGGQSDEALTDFLRDRRGYCVQFAATMAIMARHLGIPSRLDVGYTPGHNVSGTSWTVSSDDAHAWPELYIDGLGWVRFEPTPADRTGPPPAWSVPDRTDPTTAPSTTNPSTGSATPTQSARPDVGLGETGGSAGGFTFPVVPVSLVLALLLLLASPMLARMAMTRRRWSRATTPGELVLAGWEILKDVAADLGHTWDQTDTPRTLARRLQTTAQLDIPPAEALTRLARSTERVLYARDPGMVGDVRADVAEVSAALTAAADRSRRLRARYLPQSTGRLVHAVSETLADGLDWLEGIGAQVAGVLRRRRAAPSHK